MPQKSRNGTIFDKVLKNRPWWILKIQSHFWLICLLFKCIQIKPLIVVSIFLSPVSFPDTQYGYHKIPPGMSVDGHQTGSFKLIERTVPRISGYPEIL
jgi:hypothetical protein